MVLLAESQYPGGFADHAQAVEADRLCGRRLVRLSRETGVQTSPGIAATTGIPEPTVAKVLKTLAAGGLVASQRGARGGYRLLRPLATIPVADVIAAVDGPIALTACVEASVVECESQGLCPMRGRWDPVNEAIQQALAADHTGRHAGGVDPTRLPSAGAPGSMTRRVTQPRLPRSTTRPDLRRRIRCE